MKRKRIIIIVVICFVILLSATIFSIAKFNVCSNGTEKEYILFSTSKYYSKWEWQ